jgi:hypothetical protein
MSFSIQPFLGEMPFLNVFSKTSALEELIPKSLHSEGGNAKGTIYNEDPMETCVTEL